MAMKIPPGSSPNANEVCKTYTTNLAGLLASFITRDSML